MSSLKVKDQILTQEQMAEMFGIDPKSYGKAVREGRAPGMKINGKWYCTLEAITLFCANSGIPIDYATHARNILEEQMKPKEQRTIRWQVRKYTVHRLEESEKEYE